MQRSAAGSGTHRRRQVLTNSPAEFRGRSQHAASVCLRASTTAPPPAYKACGPHQQRPARLTLLHEPATALRLPPELHAARVRIAAQHLVKQLGGLHGCPLQGSRKARGLAGRQGALGSARRRRAPRCRCLQPARRPLLCSRPTCVAHCWPWRQSQTCRGAGTRRGGANLRPGLPCGGSGVRYWRPRAI